MTTKMGAEEAPVPILAMACSDEACDFKPMEMMRRPVGKFDVMFAIKYCGVCHTDVHYAANQLQPMVETKYPCVPGHELAGIVERVGSGVTKFKVGDHVGVGCILDSCGTCSSCKRGDENFCTKCTWNYLGEDNNGRATPYPEYRDDPKRPGTKQKSPIIGGYSTKHVIHENYAILIPKSYPLEYAGPMMCAGTTMHNPLTIHGAGPGMRVGIVGLGGLGFTGIKIAKAMGCVVTALSRSEAKKSKALAAGANNYVAMANADQVAAATKTMDLILDTIPCAHDPSPYLALLVPGGKHCYIGISPDGIGAMVVDGMLGGRARVGMGGLGGIAKTQELIDLADRTEPKILPDIELRPVHELNKIYQALAGANDDGVRYVLDIEGTLNSKTKDRCVEPPPQLHDQDPKSQMTVGNLLQGTCQALFRECSLPCWLHCGTCGACYKKPNFAVERTV